MYMHDWRSVVSWEAPVGVSTPDMQEQPSAAMRFLGQNYRLVKNFMMTIN